MSQPSMTSIINGVAAMDISQEDIRSKTFIPGHKPSNSQSSQKTISRQNSVSKLLTKYAKPVPFQPAPTSQSHAVRMAMASQAQHTTRQITPPSTSPRSQPPTAPSSPSKDAKRATKALDIGSYDGGFEAEVAEGRGQVVHGEAAKELALDSSQACVIFHLSECAILMESQFSPYFLMASHRL